MGRGVPHTCWLLLALCLTGILAGDWSVDLITDQICARIGSTLTLVCSYDYPQSSRETGAEGQRSAEEHEYKVLSEMWCVGDSRCITPRYVFHSDGIFLDPAYQNRVKYLGDPQTKSCSLTISDLKESDTGTYVFYLITNHPTQKMPEQRGVQLLVADPPHAIDVSIFPAGGSQQGVPVTLNCSSDDANPSVDTYTWYQGRDACAAAVEGTASHSRAKATGRILRIANISVEEIYCCVASNKHGSKSILVPRRDSVVIPKVQAISPC
ncbi:cell surface A33 antigen [Myripristis murdjan]|uniref:cell surface A33 antigen n=1 Tax=Myripristis murdjan TaxID=586833 RepID=UPI001175E9C9|nr:cell surface A33 antigen-like [Myripristis murdjan]